MAKRKAARATGRKAATARGSAGRSTGRAKAAPRKGARKAGRTSAAAPKGARKPAAGRGAGGATRSATARKAPARKATAEKAAARKVPRRSAPAARGASPATGTTRKVPNLNRQRRIVRDDDTVGSVPSSLDLDRRASAARSGRRELRQRFDEHTETSPQLTGGDVDADWESAYSVGDEAPGGDNPTPDQDIVDDIGRAVGVEYQDNEELKGADKVAKRDKHRWELDPASSEDYDDRD
jgi:Family of unknown function (DUF6335)